MSDENKVNEVEELNDEAMDDISGGKGILRWYTVYQVIRHSNPPTIVAEFNTKEEADRYAENLNGHHVEKAEVRR